MSTGCAANFSTCSRVSSWFRVRLALDRTIALVLMVVLAPVVAVCAWLVRRHDGGPAFIAVPRLGQHGRPIQMWKLRSMRADLPGGMASGVALTGEHDSRITPVGVKLRAYYLDELPQLYNVVRGDMCLLGPRPEAPEFVDLADPEWQAVLAVPPGLAGPTQLIVNDWERDVITTSPDGAAYMDEVVPVKLAIDHWYVRRASPRLDALVAFTLLRRLMPGSDMHVLRDLIRAQVPEASEAHR